MNCHSMISTNVIRDIAVIEKILTKKGNEFIEFSIEHYEQN
jgi:hypothetical protein